MYLPLGLGLGLRLERSSMLTIPLTLTLGGYESAIATILLYMPLFQPREQTKEMLNKL